MTLNQQRLWCRVAIFLATICLTIAAAQSEIGKDRTSCGRTKCKVGESRKFKYEENVSYRYRYSVDVSTNLGGGNASSWLQRWSGYPGNESTLRLDADAIVRFSSPCEGTLKFENASLSHDPRKYNPEFPDRAGAEFKVNLERYALRFAYDDGRIDELCPDKQDSVWALNLKRGFLSMIQNTMHRFDVDRRTNELDVNGVCETTYRLYEAKRTSLIVKKEKNLSDCSNGPKHFSIIRSNPYKSPRSGTRGPRHPLVESRSECELTIDRNIYETIVCKELHRLQPLSSGNTGARTESVSTIRLTGESRDDRGDADEYEEEDIENGDVDEEEEEKENRRGGKRTSLLYDYSKTLRTGELRNARDLLKMLCGLGTGTGEMQQRFSETFAAFVQSARFLNYPSLSQLFVRGNGICKSGKKHIVDALPFMGSNAAVNVMKDLIMKESVEESTIDKWVTAFALIPRPNRDTIGALSPLLEFLSRQLPESQFVLSYSTTIYAFCSGYEATACGNVEEVARFLSYLEQKLEKGCAPRAHSLSTVKETLEALKAIGNMGLETERLLERLKECVDDVGGFLPMEVRVASIDAHRRMPSCEKTRDLYFLNYYRNFTLDTEIRIASYLQVMRCPDYNVVRTIKHTLKLEEINQVGTFVWSHLTNLYKSASPTKIEIQSLLTDRDLDDKFNSDRRKFSRNYDGSFFSEEYNFGGNCQGNLIFSPKSYIPRSATFNLTFDLFGESVNVFEVTTRLEGLEYYAEKFFGPDGSLPQGSEKVSDFFKKLLRSFRAAPDEEEEENYWKRVKRLPNVIDNNFNEPKISLSYRVFGNDLKYSMLNGDREIKEALTRLDPWEKLKQITSGKEIHYENVAMFLDSTYVVPMTSGLPMRLDFAGSAACDFKMSGLLDAKGISKGEIELVSNVAPSVSVDVIGSMTVDAFYKTAGTKLRTNVYSSGAVRIHLDVKGLRSIRLSLGLPNKKMEVFSIGTDILLTKSNGADLEEKPLGMLLGGSQAGENSMRSVVSNPPVNVISNTSCTWAALDKLIGLKLCVDYQLSNVTKSSSEPYFLLTGPTLFKISLNKADPTAKNYLLEYKWTKTKEEHIFRFAFDTPGSQVNRELSATISFDVKTHNVTVLLRSAGNSLVAKGTYKSTENETFVDVGFDINGTKHLDASFGYASKKFQYGYTFSPQMHLIVNNERIVALSGTIRSSWKNNARSVSQCDIDLTFRTKRVWSKLVGYIVVRNTTSLTGDFQLEYQLQKMPKKETLRFEMSLSNRSLKGFTHKTADLKLRSTAYPQLNTVIAAWYQQAFGHLELHVEINSSPHLMDDRHKLTAQLVVSYSRMYFQNQKTKVSVLLGLTKPIQNLDKRIGINHYAVGPELKTSLLIRYAPGKDISLTVNLIKPRGLMFVMEGHANMTIPNFNSMLVDVRITERSRRTYELDFSGNWFSGHNLTARGTYTDRSEATAINHNLKLYLKSPSFADDVLLNCRLYRNYSDVSVTVYVTQEQVDRNRYAFILNHTVASPTNFVSYIEGRYKGNVYSVTTAVDTERETRMEIHLDKWRDIHLVLTTWSFGVNDVNNKGFLAEVKWDANRDPALKLAVFFSLDRTMTSTATTTTTTTTTTTVHPLKISGNQQQGGEGEGGGTERMTNVMVTLTYPGRFVVSSCRVSARNHYDYVVHATFKWNPEETIELFTATEYNVDYSSLRSISLKTQLVTPFENWKKTGLTVKYLQKQNKIVVSGSADWKDSQRLIAELEGSTEQHGNAQEWRVNCGVNSSLRSILSTTLNLTHRIVAESPQIVDTRLFVKYNPDKVINGWSVWYLDKGSEDTFNLTGNLHLESPITRYRKSDLRCQLQILPEWKFLGAANFDLDQRTYTAALTGDLRRLKESMVQFNVTTPLEKFSFVRGRFGLSERKRHVVAEVVTPATGIGTIGFEALCQLFTADYNFNVRLSLATPLELLRRSLVVAKLNNHREADFRVAYNDMLAGIQSVWHYRSITDFHYTYLLFTPVSGLEECGIITKLIATRTDDDHLSVDTEFSVRLSNVKIGAKGNIGPRPPPVTVTIPIKIPSNYTEPLPNGDGGVSEGGAANGQGQPDEEEEGEVPSLDYEEEATNLYWHGDIEVCTAVIEPVTAELDIDNEGSKCKVSGTLRYLREQISLDDTLWVEDLFNIKNELKLVLPFYFLQELDCLNVFVVDLEKSEYTMQIAVNVKRNTTWYETGMDMKYVYRETETDEPRSHVLRLNVKTPLEFIKFLDTNTSLEVQENFYRAKIGIRAPNCTADLLGSIETEEALVDTTLVIGIDAPLITLPKSTITAKRDFTSRERYVKISGEMGEPVSKSFSVRSDWYLHKDRGRASVAFNSWIEPLRNVEIDLSYLNTVGSSNGVANLTVYMRHQSDQRYKLVGNYRSNGTIDAEIYTPFKMPHFEFHGDVKKTNNDDSTFVLNGQLQNHATRHLHAVFGNVSLTRGDSSLHALEVTIRPNQSTDSDLSLANNNNNNLFLTVSRKRYSLNVTLTGRGVNGTIDVSFVNSLNWDVKASTDILRVTGKIDRLRFSTFTNVQVNGNATLYVHAETPFTEIRNVTVTGNVLMTNKTGDVRANGRFNQDTKRGIFQWSLDPADLFGRALVQYQTLSSGHGKLVDTQLFFKNPARAFKNINFGFLFNIDPEKWIFAGDANLGLTNFQHIHGVYTLRLPQPYHDYHRLVTIYHNNGGVKNTSYAIRYYAKEDQLDYASDGSILMGSRNVDAHLRACGPIHFFSNMLNVSFDAKQLGLKYRLYTPKFEGRETLVLLFDYDASLDKDRRAINANVFCPANTPLASANVSYESLLNVNGTVSAVLPLANISQFGCQFVVLTTLQRNKRYAKVFWPQDTAIVDSDYSYRSEKLDSDLKGTLHAELPLSTRHIGHLTYGYEKRAQLTNGHSELTYNQRKVLQGVYKSRSESRAGFERDRIEITIENALKPIGILYVNQYEYSAGNEGTNYPTVEFKHANLYQLDNRTAFNVVGESRIKTTHTGQNIHLKAIHANRTVQLKSDYQVLPGEFDQTSWLSLTDDVWISYHVNILNKTSEHVDNQFLTLNVSYPRRNFSLDGFYWITSEELKSEVKLDWDRETEKPRTVGALFNWANLSSNAGAKNGLQQRAIFALRHPSFEKRVYLQGELMKRDPKDFFNFTLMADYSADPSKLFAVSASLRDESHLPISRRYVYQVTGQHPSTSFDLDLRGHVYRHESRLYETLNAGSYKRRFVTGDTGKLNARLDLLDKIELLFQREHNEAVKYLNVRYYTFDRRHVANGSFVDTPNLNGTGAFFFDPNEKLTWMMLNYTPDAVESLRMHGRIPDARNAVFDIWRTYEEDFSISDLSFYLKLNHSRLISSTLRWRPELKNDIVAIVKQAAMNAYQGINNDADYWKQYVKSETVNVISDVWDDAQEELREFLDDWNNLKELQTDLDDLKVYLNNSYNANDFYIKDIVSFGIYVIDELSLRNHIQSLPNILNEIWEVMGESGEAIRNSLLSVIEAIKNAFNKVSEIVAAILRGDSITQVASIIEKLLEKYDKFVKDLHVSLIKYIENLWIQISQSISQQWNRFLLAIEPLFIRFIHYLETVAWKASKEVIDFLYDRGNDLIASPYFDRFTNFTQDIDRFYRDIKANDIVTNIQKYSGLVIRFLKEKYFTFVPFGKELRDVVDEIVNELKELQKLPTIRYACEKMQQVYDRAYYVYDYLEIRAKIESVVRLIHSKLMDVGQTALQAENRYREAKTMFIFDPNEGLMCFEQKLPMSWHAFNQTPEFHEIPEFRAIADLKSYFVSSNMTFWSVYRYKSYADPANWLPPFKAQAMIVGSSHFITFDGRHLDFFVDRPSTYLLAHDFVRDTFTILLEYEPRADRVTHKIIVLLGHHALELDIFNDSIKLVTESSTESNLVLPLELENGTTYVYQTDGVVTVERKKNQLQLECNLKFDLCTLKLSGWYHGKTAGILGTMNYEPTDDTLASNGIVERNVTTFAESWSIDRHNDKHRSSTDPSSNVTTVTVTGNFDADKEQPLVTEFCNELFVDKYSQFGNCFDVVEPNEYAKLCLRTARSKSEVCTLALSYMQVCMFRETHLRIPDVCSSCSMIDGRQVAEGQFEKVEGDRVARSTDVVFIVEGKQCNYALKENRSVEQLVAQLSKEFRDRGLVENRWSLVVFGADGVFDRPRSIVFDGQIFTKSSPRFVDYFDHVPIGNGSQDIFAAIAYASKLVFRAGVSKTFILMPCSHCEPENQTLDYSVIHQVLLEQDITLHILMDGDFEFEKERLNKIFYGLDATRSYTKKDARTLIGDVDLRRQVKLSKTVLGYCTPLALEINGTVFTGDKLRFDKLPSIKKFASVFSKRVALTARPNPCQNCECTVDNNGVTRMECIPCVYPTPISVDYETYNNLNASYTSLQPPFNFDYDQIDVDDS